MTSSVDLYELAMDPEYRQKLSEAVRRARGDRAQRKFAKDLGVSYPAVRSWEEGESLPGLENLELIADTLGYTLEEFLLYLRGEESDSDRRRPKVAEDLMPVVDQLSRTELVRLAQILVSKLGAENDK